MAARAKTAKSTGGGMNADGVLCGKMGAFQFLGMETPSIDTFPALCAIAGGDAFLRSRCDARLRDGLRPDRIADTNTDDDAADDAEFSISVFDGASANTTLRALLSDLASRNLFGGGGRRLVIVEQADDLVSRHRTELEAYAAAPKPTSILVLEPQSFPGNTRLAKMFEEKGIVIDCASPKESDVRRWLTDWAKREHRVRLDTEAVDRLLEMVGPSPGLLDSELARLALLAPAPEGTALSTITAEMVEQFGGNWRTRTVWELLDRTLEGNVRAALEHLDRLLSGGDAPIMILASISLTLRRFAAAARIFRQASQIRRSMSLRESLEAAGTKPFLLRSAEEQLKRLGPARAEKLYQTLVEADLALKGESRLDPRTTLERLLIHLAVSPDAM